MLKLKENKLVLDKIVCKNEKQNVRVHALVKARVDYWVKQVLVFVCVRFCVCLLSKSVIKLLLIFRKVDLFKDF